MRFGLVLNQIRLVPAEYFHQFEVHMLPLGAAGIAQEVAELISLYVHTYIHT